MALLVELGIYSADEAERIRSAGEDVIRMIEKREPPFDEEWIGWQPDPDLRLGEAPQGWQFRRSTPHRRMAAPSRPGQIRGRAPDCSRHCLHHAVDMLYELPFAPAAQLPGQETLDVIVAQILDTGVK
jgi:hypothetical protein